jgi:hypothetical protein
MTGNRNRLICFFFALVVCVNLTVSEDQQFSHLAESFLSGKTYFLAPPASGHDTAVFQGKYYWPLGPFPAVLLSPLVFLFRSFNVFFFQSYLQIFLVFGVFYLLFKIARRIGYSSDDAGYLACAYCFASAFLGVAIYSGSWYFAQVVAVFLLVLALLEFVGKKRLWVIGTLMALTVLTRVTAGLNILFFVMVAAVEDSALRRKISSIFALSFPVLLALFALALYNDARLGNWLEQGYSLQILSGAAARARAYGVVSLSHVPGNIFYFLFAGPLPVTLDNVSQVLKFPYLRANPWGMSLFITSPYFLYLFCVKYNDLNSKLLLVSIAVVAGCVFTYYGIGNVQFGYRYSLDFLPFLFFLLIRNYRNDHQQLSENFKRIILITAVTNTYLVLTILQFDWYTNL